MDPLWKNYASAAYSESAIPPVSRMPWSTPITCESSKAATRSPSPTSRPTRGNTYFSLSDPQRPADYVLSIREPNSVLENYKYLNHVRAEELPGIHLCVDAQGSLCLRFSQRSFHSMPPRL